MPACRTLLPLLLLTAFALFGCSTPSPMPTAPVAAPSIVPTPRPPARIALVLGGGAARGFAHIGVIKGLEAQGIYPDIVVGTSAGSVVGALYAAGYNGIELQELAMKMQVEQIVEGSVFYQCLLNAPFNRGCFKGELLQDFINRTVKQRPIEKLNRLYAAVATHLDSGEMVVFRNGNTGMAVRASSAVPIFFQPVNINGQDYVDGGLVAPVPVGVARSLGADFIIAVDISDQPQNRKPEGLFDVLWQTFTIFSQRINRNELAQADITVRPVTADLTATDFNDRHRAVLEGEKAFAAVLPELKQKLLKLNETRQVPGLP